MSITVQRLFIYPIKSLQPVEVEKAELTDTGLRFDRSFALIYAQPELTLPGDEPPLVRHLTIKRTFALSLFQPTIDATWSNLTIHYLGSGQSSHVTVPLVPSPLSSANAGQFRLNIFGTSAIGIDSGSDAAAFFSKHLSTEVRLVFIGNEGRRDIPGSPYDLDWLKVASRYTTESDGSRRSQKIKFADASPLLVTSTASEIETRSRLPVEKRHEDVILQFRPNLHVNTSNSLPAWDEDHWHILTICRSETDERCTIRCFYPCVRCLSINADPLTGEMLPRDQQFYGLLARDRRVNKTFPQKPVFGQYAFGFPYGFSIRVGDTVTITGRS